MRDACVGKMMKGIWGRMRPDCECMAVDLNRVVSCSLPVACRLTLYSRVLACAPMDLSGSDQLRHVAS